MNHGQIHEARLARFSNTSLTTKKPLPQPSLPPQTPRPPVVRCPGTNPQNDDPSYSLRKRNIHHYFNDSDEDGGAAASATSGRPQKHQPANLKTEDQPPTKKMRKIGVPDKTAEFRQLHPGLPPPFGSDHFEFKKPPNWREMSLEERQACRRADKSAKLEVRMESAIDTYAKGLLDNLNHLSRYFHVPKVGLRDRLKQRNMLRETQPEKSFGDDAGKHSRSRQRSRSPQRRVDDDNGRVNNGGLPSPLTREEELNLVETIMNLVRNHRKPPYYWIRDMVNHDLLAKWGPGSPSIHKGWVAAFIRRHGSLSDAYLNRRLLDSYRPGMEQHRPAIAACQSFELPERPKSEQRSFGPPSAPRAMLSSTSRSTDPSSPSPPRQSASPQHVKISEPQLLQPASSQPVKGRSPSPQESASPVHASNRSSSSPSSTTSSSSSFSPPPGPDYAKPSSIFVPMDDPTDTIIVKREPDSDCEPPPEKVPERHDIHPEPEPEEVPEEPTAHIRKKAKRSHKTTSSPSSVPAIRNVSAVQVKKEAEADIEAETVQATPSTAAHEPPSEHATQPPPTDPSFLRTGHSVEIRLRVTYGDDSRIVVVDPALDFPTLMAKLQKKFGTKKPLRMKVEYTAEDGMITIGDQEDLDVILSDVRKMAYRKGLDSGQLQVFVTEVQHKTRKSRTK